MSYAPDFGLFMSNQLKSGAEHTFLPFKIYHVSVLSEEAYTTTANINWGETFYAVSMD